MCAQLELLNPFNAEGWINYWLSFCLPVCCATWATCIITLTLYMCIQSRLACVFVF